MSHRFLATCCDCSHDQYVEPRDVTQARPPHCIKCGGPLEYARESLRLLGSIKNEIAPIQDGDWDSLYSWFKMGVGADWKPPEGDEGLSPAVVEKQPLQQAVHYMANGDARHTSPTAIIRLVGLELVEIEENGRPSLTAKGERCYQRLRRGEKVAELTDEEDVDG